MSRAEVDLQISVRKACNGEEVPPKRKHVRACIVYTWDHKNSRAFWNAVKIQPLQSSEVQLFKALIMIHKVLQEGHPNTLKDGYRNRDFLYSLSTVFPNTSNYGMLINQYDRFLLQKLDFHRGNPGFNGIFEYEEYISLRTVNDPNEGYESILQLMDLQDSISDLQKHIFATVHQSPNNLCKVSALVPLISESYGVYKFLVSMLKAMFKQLGDDDALSALIERFNSQHYVLRDFYTDCQSIKFLTSLITIPRIAASVPNLNSVETQNSSPSIEGQDKTINFDGSEAPPPLNQITYEQADPLDQQDQLQQDQLEQHQQHLEAQRQLQLQDQSRRQQMFEQQVREQEQRRYEEQQMLKQQQTQNYSRVSELEQDLLVFKAQFDSDQTLLQQYDSRVKSMESELSSINEVAAHQIASKDEQVKLANEQMSNWSKKYESLAKLYSQLRSEHLNLLAKFKKIQQKISSAQESILKKEKYEKDLKSKNLELAEIIRERDRARLDVDRVRASKDQELELLQLQMKETSLKATDSSAENNSVLLGKILKYEKEIDELKLKLVEREHALASLGNVNQLRESLKEKEIDLEITQESLDSALKELASAKPTPNADLLISLLDVVLANSVRRVQDLKYELSSPMQAGNSNATPEYLLSFLDSCSDSATNFAQAFNDLVIEEMKTSSDSACAKVILTSSDLTTTLNDLMLNSKGLRNIISIDEGEELFNLVTRVLTGAESFFSSLTSDLMNNLESVDDKIDFVIDCNLSIQHLLQLASAFIDTLRGDHETDYTQSENIENIVESKFSQTASTVEQASFFLQNLMSEISERQDFEVHEALLASALAITKAVSALITSAIDSQVEIVARNKGAASRGEFYKRNSRWTEGLVSAAKAVAGATNILIQTANGILNQENIYEQLIVACNEVAASTAQLVAAARVKANFVSKTQQNLETSSRTVNSACKALVVEVENSIGVNEQVDEKLNLEKLTPYEGKTLEMEQQVEILKLENSLFSARKKLAEIRKHGYADDISGDES